MTFHEKLELFMMGKKNVFEISLKPKVSENNGEEFTSRYSCLLIPSSFQEASYFFVISFQRE